MKRIITLLLFSFTALFINAQSITVNTPNGGETLYSCQNYNITWSSSGVSDYYDIEYSLDGGTIWASIATNYYSSTGTFTWNIPTVSSAQCLIRIKDAQNTSTLDQSNSNFTITIPVVVTLPNGGESIQGGSSYLITWTAQGTSNVFDVFYSLNGGSSWATVAINYASGTGTYNWAVPNSPSTNCKIKVQDHTTGCMVDISDAVFTITPDDPVLLTPNGGEILDAGCVYNISWDATTFYSNIRIDYSLNGGSTWASIATNYNSSYGSYNWTIPSNALSTTCLVRVQDAVDPSVTDQSDADFTISEPISIVNSNGGDAMQGGDTYTISWNTISGSSDIFDIYYSINGGASWSTVIYNYASTSHVYNWTVPNNPSTNCKFKIRDHNNTCKEDISDANFTITADDPVLLSPNGGENIDANCVYRIMWDASTFYSNIKIDYSINGGSTWASIATNYTSSYGYYDWTVPANAVSTNCLVRVQDAVTPSIFDVSDATFNINAPISIVNSNGGDTLQGGDNYSITWTTTATSSNVFDIYYSLNGGASWSYVVNNYTSATGSYLWSVPNTPSSTCKFKIRDDNAYCKIDISDTDFTIIPDDPQLIYPNGGEILDAGCYYSITWDPAKFHSNIRIDYSIDNGTTWASIATNYYHTGGSYNWLIPINAVSTNCLVRVQTASNLSESDQSDATFTISTPITVVNSNGGDTAKAGENYTINWTTGPGTSNVFRIDYSVNGGTSWSTVVNNYSTTTGTYVWDVPNNPSENCRIRVRDYNNLCKADVSDADFTILPADPILISPNGGEILSAGCHQSIYWHASSFYTNVKLEYSLDNGATWILIVASTSNDGGFSWETPNSTSSQVLIRASNVGDPVYTDVSDATFSLVPAITIISSNGGDTAVGCGTYDISWEKPGYCISKYTINYSIDNGASWVIIDYPNNNGSATSQTYSWDVPNNLNSSTALFRVQNYNNSFINDVSDANFTIIPSNDITITSPNGGENFDPYSTQLITWTNLPLASGAYTIQYSTNGTNFYDIATNVTGNAYNWSVPKLPSTNCYIKVKDFNSSCRYDISDNPFTINTPIPEMTFPNGNDTLSAGCNTSINWNDSTYYSNVRIDYSINGGTTWTNITTSTNNDGHFAWPMSVGVYGNDYKIKVSNTADLLLNDDSDASFVIENPLEMTNSNGGDTLIGCQEYMIRWGKANDCISRYNLYYSTNNGTSWNTIFTNQYHYQYYNWTIPNNLNSTTCLFKVVDYNHSYVYDISDANFTILPSNEITVTSPDGGEVFAPYSSQLVTWTSLPTTSGIFDIEYSYNGYSFHTVTSNIIGNAYSWTVPNTPTSNYKIKVIDHNNTCKQDKSDATFMVTPLAPKLNWPNGGDTLDAGCNVTINWNDSTFYNNVRLDYSSDGGTTWLPIIASTSNDGQHSWTPPAAVYGSNYKVKVSSVSDLSLFDISDNTFTVVNPIRIISSNGGDTLTGCSTYYITFKKPQAACFYYFKISYSTDNGSTWNSIINSLNLYYNSIGVYSWTVPNNINSSSVLFKVENKNDANTFDISDATFTILPSNDITVTTPNGGESFPAYSNQVIDWTNEINASGTYNLQYSLNGGSSYTSIISNINTNTYTWSVPNSTSSNCLIKVIDANNTCKYDVSDAIFQISPQSPELISPNGLSDTLIAGCGNTITWNDSTFSSSVGITYSPDNGVTWNTITNSTANDGTYDWTPPASAFGSNYLIKIYKYGNILINAVSDTTFTMANSISNVASSVDTIIGCNEMTVSWNKTGDCLSYFKFYYSIDNGAWVYYDYFSNSGTGDFQTYNFTPSNAMATSGSNIKFRIENYSNSAVYEVSPNYELIPSNDITVITPNGGEILTPGSTQLITWTNTVEASGLYNIRYTRNGTSFYSVASNITGNAYSWIVPNIPSNVYSVRVYDGNNTCKYDVSDADFTVSPKTSLLLSPNGVDDTLIYFCENNITWDQTTFYNNIRLDYSLTGGASWIAITTNTSNDGVYEWSPPINVTGSNFKIRISDSSDATVYDESDASFTVIKPINIITPNGGDTLIGCSTYPVTFNKPLYSCISRFDFYVSDDNGTSWDFISYAYNNNSSGNTQTFNWTVGNSYNTTQALFRIVDHASSNIYDISDANFTIIPDPIIITSPTTGDTAIGCSVFPITFTKPTDCITRYRLYYSDDNGTVWNYITQVNNISGSTSQTYNWTVPNNINSTTALIKIEDRYDASIFGISQNFTLQTSHDITVNFPNGGEVFPADSVVAINWSNEPVTSGLYKVFSFVDGSYTLLGENITGNAFNWTVPNVQSSTGYVKIFDQNNTCMNDFSDANFSITPRVPVMTSPNGGEIWYAKTSHYITWNNSTYFSSYVRIDYSLDNGTSWINLETSTANDGSYAWNIPNISSQAALIRVSNVDDITIYDESDFVFNFKPAVTVITPNGDNGITTWGGCTVTSISFDHSPYYNRFNIKYSLNNGVTWNAIVNNWFQTANPATYNWTIPNTASTDVLVKVEPYYETSYADQSDATFTVTQPVTLIQPNFGGIMQVGTIYTISWSSTGISNLYNIDYSTNGGGSWSNIVTGYNTSTNTFPWSVPNTVSTNCKIRISDYIESCKEDISDVPFTISSTPPALTLTNPNGAEDVSGCNTYNILWDETSEHGHYDIAYSTNNGSTWTDIVLNYATTTHSYIWTVPNISSASTLIRVKATGTAIQDLSDALFSLVPETINITNSDTTIYNSQFVQLNVSGGTTYSWSPSSSLTNAGISNPVATPTSTTTYTVQSSSGSCTLSDDVTITVLPADFAIVTISENTNNVCDGTTITYTASSTNEGTAPAYQWFVNGAMVGTNLATYSSSILNNNDEVYVVLTSNEVGLFNHIDTSNVILMNMISNVSASVSFVSDNGSTICANTSTTFTATPTNGGTPTYQWQVNNMNVGINSNTYTTNSLVDNDQVRVLMTSDVNCILNNPATSVAMSMTVTSDVLASLNITSLGGNIICGSNNSTFVANPTNGGTTPSYQWKVNGIDVGTNNSTFATTTLVDNDVVNCILTSNENCVSNNPVTSNSIMMVVSTSITPSVTVTTPSSAFCSGTATTFTANPTNGGTAPAYQWYLNEIMVGTNMSTFTSSSLNDEDSIYVVLTSNANCLDTNVAMSNMIHLTVTTIPTQPIAITGDVNVCETENKTYTIPTVAGADSYSWSLPVGWTGSSVTNSITVVTGNTNGNVSVVATNSCGNSLAQVLAVSSNADPVVTANATDVSVCNGENIILTGTGASTYTWDNSAMNGVSFAPLMNTTYTVIGTDVNGCTATDQITISVNALPAVTANASSTTLCSGESVTLNGSGANTYSWNNSVTDNVVFSPASTNSYTVTGTDANGCSATDAITVNVSPAPIVNGGADVVVCNGDAVTLVGSGANTYTWNNGVTDNTAFNLTSSGTYVVTGVVGSSCVGYDTVEVTVNNNPTISVSSTDNAVCIGNSVTLTASGANTYSWNNGISNGVAFIPSNTLTYTVIGTDVNSCSSTADYTLTVNNPPVITASVDDNTVCDGEVVTLNGSGASTYTWDNGALNNVAFVPPVGTTTYTVSATDVNGCSATDNVDVTVSSLPTVNAGSDVTLCANSNLTLNGSGANTYTWNYGITNGAPFVVTNSTTYTVTGADGNGCTATDNILVTASPLPTVLANTTASTICNGEMITLTGSGATSYTWNNGVLDGVAFTPSVTTTYTVTGTDGNGCTSTAQITIVVNNLPTVVATADDNSICIGENVTLTGSGANSYTWNNGVTNNIAFAPTTGTITYIVAGTDANGCTNTASTDVEVNILPTVSAGSDVAVCTNATITLTGSGANSYSWNNGVTNGNSFIVTGNSTYTVTGTDGNGCIATDDVIVTANSLPPVVANTTASSICNGEMITLTGSGATSYTWNNGVADGVAFTPSTTTTYTVTGTNAIGCTSTAQITITVNDLPTVVANADDNSICIGDNVTLTGSGANSYTWDNGVANNIAFAPTTGTITYTVTGTDANGCTNTASTDVEVNNSPTVSAGNDVTVCANASLTLTGTGASTYTWNNGITNATAFTITGTNTYIVTGTDGNGCSATDDVTVTANVSPTVMANATATSICNGAMITLTGSGATSYTWNNGVTDGVAFTPSATTTYIVTGTDGNGCASTAQITITVNNLPTVVANADDNSICIGENVTLTGSGANSYTWDSGVTNNIAFAPATGTTTYTVTGTDVNGCINTASTDVEVNNLPTISAGSDVTVCANTSLTLSGSGAVSYTWNNGITDGTAFLVTSSTTYTVTGTDGNGCSATDDVVVTANPSSTVVANSTATSICIGEMITLTGSGATSYSWNNGVTDGTSFAPTATTTYTVTATNANGCVSTDQITITVNSLPTVFAGNDVSECQNTTLTLSGSGAVSYAWNNGISDNTAFNVLVTQTYTVTGTDANGCTATDDVTVTMNSLPIVVANTNASAVCNGSTVTLTGSGASSYSWNNGVNDNTAFAPSSTLTYMVTGTDTNGCTDSDQVTVVVNSLPTVVANATNNTVCAGNAITLSGSGASSYTWNNGVVDNSSFTPTSSINYTVTGTDINGCTDTDIIPITVNSIPTVDAGTDVTVCANTMIVVSGSGALTYSWNNGVTDNVAFNALTSNSYTVTGTDANGCTDTDVKIVTVEVAPIVIANASASTLCNGEQLTLSGSGADSYTWNFGVTDNVQFSPSGTLTYTVTGTTTNGCFNTDQVTVAVNSVPSVIANTTDNNICIGESITLNGSGTSTYSWNNGAVDNTSFAPSTTATYTVTGSDANGCTNTSSVLITVNALPVVDAGNAQSVCGNALVTLNGSGANSYAWNNGVTNGLPFNITSTSSYTVTGTDVNGCSASDNVIVTINATPTVTASSTDTEICAGETVTLTGTGATSITWDNGATNNVALTPTTTTTYTVTGDNGTGCLGTNQLTVIVNALPTVTAFTTDNNICAGEMITLTGSGATNYSWNNGASNNTAFIPATTNYTVTGTDASNCSNTANVSVTVMPLPNVSAGSDINICENGTVTLSGSGANSYVWDNGVINNAAFNASSSNTYTVIGTDVNNCSSSDVLVLTMFDLPNVTANATPEEVCNGEELLLNGAGAATYAWNNSVVNNVGFVPSTSNTYSVTGTSINGCISTAVVSVPVNENPVVNITQQQGEINGGDGFIDISVTAGTPIYTFDWNNDGTGDFDDPEDLNNLSTGTYIVVVKDENGCTDSKRTELGSVVAIDDLDNELNEITLYPNPNQGVFKLLIGKTQTEDIIVEVFDISGKLIVADKVHANDSELLLDLRNVSTGQYFLHMRTMKYSSVKKFTVLR